MLNEKEIKKIQEQMEKDIPLYSFHVKLSADGSINIYSECSDEAELMQDKYGEKYMAIEAMLVKDVEDSVMLYRKSVELLGKRG